MRKKRWIPLLLASLLLSACSSAAPSETPDLSQADLNDAVQEDTESAEGAGSETDQNSGREASALPGDYDKNLCGDWVFMCGTSSTSDSEDSYFYMADQEPVGGNIYIYEEDTGLYADLELHSYESLLESYHIPVSIKKGPLFPECSNQDWYAEIKNPRSDTTYTVTLTGKNELLRYEKSTYDGGEEESSWTNEEKETYVRKDSEEAKDPDRYRFFNTVTVSTAEELLNSISSNTKILLQEGEYNLSEVKGGTLNPSVYTEVDKFSRSLDTISVQIRNVTDLAIEAAPRSKVLICINDVNSPVLSLFECCRVSLKGLTCGHHAEPGTCGGSVISTWSSSETTVSQCKLYGCGTYGIESYGGYGIYVTDSEIYKCTYGIASFSETSNIHFTNCKMYDNTELTMLDFNQCYDAFFENCTFTNNIANTESFGGSPFVSARDGGSITFENCSFDGNQYAGFTDTDEHVITNHCVFHDKELGYG